MAISFREFPWYIHVLIYVALAVVLVLAGEFLPFSPVQQTRANLDRLNQEHQKLTQEVTARSEEHTSELQSRLHLVCRLLLEKKKNKTDCTVARQQTPDLQRPVLMT